MELISISLLLNEQTQAGTKRINVLWLLFTFDLHWTRVGKDLATLGHSRDTSVLNKALGCKAEIVAVSMQIGTRESCYCHVVWSGPCKQLDTNLEPGMRGK